VHRDIKPANVFVRQSSAREATPVRVKILDFGIAKVTAGPGDGGFQTQKGSLLGTPYYLAPERVLGETLTPAADVYSVGVILYEMLTGDVPFVAESFMGVLARHVQTQPLDPRQAAPERGIPDSVAGLCMRLLAKQPGARGSADQVAHELRELLVGEGGRLAGVCTGPRAESGAIGLDTQVLAEAGIHERPTLAPVTAAMIVGPPTSWSAIAAAPARPSRRIWLPWVIGVAVVLGVGVATLAAIMLGEEPTEPSDRVMEREVDPTPPPIDAAPATEPAVIEPTVIEVKPAAVLGPTPDQQPAPEGTAPSAEVPEPAPTRPRGTSSKPKSVEPKSVEPKPEPVPEPEPPKPKPIEDDSVPTIKDDIYD
jgi:serine/threonine-protein kinase